jgi:hypothetical protein
VTATTTRKAKAPARPKAGDFLTDGFVLVEVRRARPDYALVEDVRSDVEHPDILCLPWDRIAEGWRKVRRGSG